ncbi:MAG TPA: FHA domain-containing protein [Gemmataceae bacterium]|nr:FHA domain-containing protein [Gemmataceae bacterium]
MDDPSKPADESPLPLLRPHGHRGPDPELPPGFFPLRLVLRPTGAGVDLTRPDMVVGRHSQADIRLPLPDVSRRHCRFLFLDGHWEVFDLNSLNGTFVNERRVRHAVLHDRDTIRMGGFTFEVRLAISDPTIELPARPAPRDLIGRIVEALPSENDRQARRAS